MKIKQRNKKNEKVNDIQELAQNFFNSPTERNFALLMNRCKWGVRSFIFNMLQNNEATDDVFSRVMEHVYFKRNTFDNNMSKFSTWMYKIALNDTRKFLERGCMGYIESKDIINVDINDICNTYIDADYDCDSELNEFALSEDGIGNGLIDIMFNGKTFETYTKERVILDVYDASIQCMKNLPDNLRIVLQERYINMKSIEEIARDNKIPISSVKNWLRKGENSINDEIKRNHSNLYDIYNDLAS